MACSFVLQGLPGLHLVCLASKQIAQMHTWHAAARASMHHTHGCRATAQVCTQTVCKHARPDGPLLTLPRSARVCCSHRMHTRSPTATGWPPAAGCVTLTVIREPLIGMSASWYRWPLMYTKESGWWRAAMPCSTVSAVSGMNAATSDHHCGAGYLQQARHSSQLAITHTQQSAAQALCHCCCCLPLARGIRYQR